MTSFEAHPSTSNEYNFEAYGTHYGASYHLIGTCSKPGSACVILVSFSIHYSQEFRSKYFSGYLRDDITIVGTEGWTEDRATHQNRFILKRVPGEIMCCRPSPREFRQNRAVALWKYARAASLYLARRKLWSKSLFTERWEARRAYIDYDIRNYTPYGRPLNKAERATWAEKRGTITALDASFYRPIRDTQLRLVPTHL
jgi:hypothetical protein